MFAEHGLHALLSRLSLLWGLWQHAAHVQSTPASHGRVLTSSAPTSPGRVMASIELPNHFWQ
eukprot:9101495-Prorocentrum_lima.AAC.1